LRHAAPYLRHAAPYLRHAAPFCATPHPFCATPHPICATPHPTCATPHPICATPHPICATPHPISVQFRAPSSEHLPSTAPPRWYVTHQQDSTAVTPVPRDLNVYYCAGHPTPPPQHLRIVL
jgi:hypothetical protein